MSASVLDDIIGLMLMAIVIGTGSLLVLSAKIVALFLITLFIGLRIISKVMDIGDRTRSTETLVAFSIAICFIFGVISKGAVMTQVVGAFIAGLIINTTVQSKRILPVIRTIGYSLFIPLFFVHIGTLVNLSVFFTSKALILGIVIVFAAIVGKILGCGAGARIGGFTARKALQVGVAALPRAEVALITVTTAIYTGAIRGVVADTLIAATLMVVIVTTFITPPLIKLSFNKELAAMSGGKR